MPFREPFDTYYRDVIRPAVQSLGLGVMRSDEIYSAGAFVQTIWTQILEASAVVAEMTGANANVLYELGLCHAIDRKVVMIAQDAASVPSDLRHMNFVLYDTTRPNWADLLQESLKRMLLFNDDGRRHTILTPVARVDNTILFERLERQVRDSTIQVRERDFQVSDLTDQLASVKHELGQARALVAPGDRPNRSALNYMVRDQDGIVSAFVKLPGTDNELVEYVYVPEGDFFFGEGRNGTEARLPAYWISRYAITNQQYCAFLNAVGLHVEEGVPWIDIHGESPADQCRIELRDRLYEVDEAFAEFPVTYVNYYGALAFSEWAGGFLPSVEQWEKAARGVDGRPYPWGTHPPDPSLVNMAEDGWSRDVSPINVKLRRKGASPFGMVQPIGNVWHWTSTYYPDRNVQAVRGGSFFDFRLGRREVYRFVVQPDGPDFSQSLVVCQRFLEVGVDLRTAARSDA
jgi:formylglycine-generating enzyme required for sulfatase activity